MTEWQPIKDYRGGRKMFFFPAIPAVYYVKQMLQPLIRVQTNATFCGRRNATHFMDLPEPPK